MRQDAIGTIRTRTHRARSAACRGSRLRGHDAGTCRQRRGAGAHGARARRLVRLRLHASLDRPRPCAGDGGGRPVGRPQRRAGAVGLAGRVRRRDAGGRRARHGRRRRAAGGAGHPRLGDRARACWCWPRRGCRSRSARRSLRVFALLHGHAHGAELPAAAAAATYAAGFALATALLHAHRPRRRLSVPQR